MYYKDTLKVALDYLYQRLVATNPGVSILKNYGFLTPQFKFPAIILALQNDEMVQNSIGGRLLHTTGISVLCVVKYKASDDDAILNLLDSAYDGALTCREQSGFPNLDLRVVRVAFEYDRLENVIIQKAEMFLKFEEEEE